MRTTEISTVTVFGAGTMGRGIAEVAALAGFDVFLRDVSTETVQAGYDEIEWSLDKLLEHDEIDEAKRDASLERITPVVNVPEAAETADYVIEAVPERSDLKKAVFADIEHHAPEHAILATNTSCLSIRDLSGGTERPRKFCGMHFFSPALHMDLVEVIPGPETTEQTVETVERMAEAMGKTPIRVRKDSPAFIVNRVINPLCNEAAWIVESGDATMTEVDATAVHELDLPMGLFEIADLAGIDIVVDVLEYLSERIGPAYTPCSLLRRKVERDELGRKTDRGFYDYDGSKREFSRDDARPALARRLKGTMANETAKLIEEDVADPGDIDTAMQLGAGFPRGPVTMADDADVPTLREVLAELYDRTEDPRYEPAGLLTELATADRGFTDLVET